MTLGFAVVFAGHSGYLHYLHWLTSHELATLWHKCDEKRNSKFQIHVVIRSSMHPCPGNFVAIGHAVVFYARLSTHLVQQLNAATLQLS